MSAIRMMRSRVPAARCLRSQSSGTKTYGRAKTTSFAGDPDVDARLSLRQRGNGRVGEGERPVGSRLQLGGTRRHFPDLSATGVEAEPLGDGLHGQRPRVPLLERRAGAIFRHDVADAQHAAVCGDQHAPFLCPIGDVALERRDADRPAGRGQVGADQFTPPRFAGGLGDELVRPVAAVERQRHHAPFAIEGDAALGHGPPRRRLGVLTRGRQSPRPGSQACCGDGHERDRPDRQPCHPGAWSDGRLRRFVDDGVAFDGGRRHPGTVAIGRRKLRPASGLGAPDEHDPQRDEHEQRDHGLLHPDARRVREQDGNGEQHDVERVVQDDAWQQAVVKVEQAEADRGEDQLHRPCVRRLGRILRMPAAEYQGLHDEPDNQEEPPLAEAVADEGRPGERHRAEQRFLPEAGLEGVGDRREPGRVGGEHVRLQHRLGGRPPAEVLRGDVIQHHVVREEDRDEQVRAGRPPEDLDRRARRGGVVAGRRSARPRAPQLRVVSEGAARQRLGRHERQCEERREADQAGDDERRLLRQERRARQRRVVGHPLERQLVDHGQRLHDADGDAPRGGLPPQQPPRPEHEEQPDADAAHDVEQHHADRRAHADGVVGRSHVGVAAGKGLGDAHEVRDFRQPVARHHQAQPVAACAGGGVPALVGDGVIDAPADAALLALLRDGELREVDVPPRCRVLGERARGGGVERRPGLVLLQFLDEAIQPAFGREPDRGLVRLAFLELPDPPAVGGVEAVLQHRRERVLAARFQLDEGLRLTVERERGGLAIPGRPERLARHDVARLGERLLAVHRDVERDDREGAREVAHRHHRGGEGEDRQYQPERRTPHKCSSLASAVSYQNVLF